MICAFCIVFSTLCLFVDCVSFNVPTTPLHVKLCPYIRMSLHFFSVCHSACYSLKRIFNGVIFLTSKENWYRNICLAATALSKALPTRTFQRLAETYTRKHEATEHQRLSPTTGLFLSDVVRSIHFALVLKVAHRALKLGLLLAPLGTLLI